MKSGIHLMIVTTLSMIITFALHCSLKNTRANGFIIQNILIDPTREQLLRTCCLWNNGIFNEMCKYFDNDNFSIYSLIPFIILEMAWMFSCYFKESLYCIRPIIYTIVSSLVLARCCDALDIFFQMDTFTVYFLIWQIMSVITEWESKKLPLVSLTFYRGWLCIITASMTFVVHDFLFRYLPIQFNFLLLWTTAIYDIIYCLHPESHVRNKRTLEELAGDGKPSLNDVYYTWDFDDNKSDRKKDRACLGIGDFVMFNFMLLFILPPLSSMRTKLCITIGHIIAVHISQEATNRFGRLCNQWVRPAVPLPVIVVSIHALLLNIFIEY